MILQSGLQNIRAWQCICDVGRQDGVLGHGRRSWSLVSIWWTRMSRDQPCSMAARAYQSLCPSSWSLSKSVTFWPQGNCATICCTICWSGQVRANFRIYFRFLGEKPPLQQPPAPAAAAALRHRAKYVP
jgi:hypothetical protein